MTDVIKTRPLLEDEWLNRARVQDVATIHEAMGKKGAMEHSIKPLSRNMRMCGRALTVKCHPGDNLMLIKAVSIAGPGDIIVADMGHLIDNGPFGEVLAVECISKQIAGLVVSCSVRDSEAIIRREFPVFSAGISVFGTSKAVKGAINHPVVVGGVTVYPGDLVLGDADGVVVIPFNEVETTVVKAENRQAGEKVTMERLFNGESLWEIYGYQKVFDDLGITEEG